MVGSSNNERTNQVVIEALRSRRFRVEYVDITGSSCALQQDFQVRRLRIEGWHMHQRSWEMNNGCPSVVTSLCAGTSKLVTSVLLPGCVYGSVLVVDALSWINQEPINMLAQIN